MFLTCKTSANSRDEKGAVAVSLRLCRLRWFCKQGTIGTLQYSYASKYIFQTNNLYRTTNYDFYSTLVHAFPSFRDSLFLCAPRSKHSSSAFAHLRWNVEVWSEKSIPWSKSFYLENSFAGKPAYRFFFFLRKGQ